MMFIFLIFLVVSMTHSQSFSWYCREKKDFSLSNEQCTITVEYISTTHEEQICQAHTLSIRALPSYSNYTMKIFRINACQLLTLTQIPFTLPSSLEELDLRHNLLSTFTLALPLPSSLKALHLDHNPNLIEINFSHQHMQRQLVHLSLAYNQDIQLSSLPLHLTKLDLTACHLSQSSTLSLIASLPELTHLSLGDNQLRQLPKLNERVQLQYLNLSNNQLTVIESRELNEQLKVLDLRFNRIKSVDFLNKRVLTFKQQSMSDSILQLSLYGNPLMCDCWLGSLLASPAINITDLSILQCDSRSVLSTPSEQFLCPYTRHCASDCSCCDFEACDCHSVCPSECLCYHDILWSKHLVQCRGKNFSSIPLLLPETVTELNYEDNHIERLRPFTFVGKNSLVQLNLARNRLTTLTNETFCAASHLREINLSFNPDLISLLPNIDYWFGCLKDLQTIILSKEQIRAGDEQLSSGWFMEVKNDSIRLTRRSSSVSLSSSTTKLTTISSSLQFESRFSIYHHELFTTPTTAQYNSTLILIVFFLLLFVLLFSILLISLAICRRKLRRHLDNELQRQRASQYYYQPTLKKPETNGTSATNDSLYEQLPSVSSDSEQPFLYNVKKSNPPPPPPALPPKCPHYHYCHSNADYSSTNAVLLLGNQLLYPHHHHHREYSSEIQPCFSQDNNAMHYCNKDSIVFPSPLCRCNGHVPRTDNYIYPHVHR